MDNKCQVCGATPEEYVDSLDNEDIFGIKDGLYCEDCWSKTFRVAYPKFEKWLEDRYKHGQV